MNTPFDTSQPASTANKPLWAAVIVLGVAVLAMAATLVRIQSKPEEPRLAVLSAPAPAPLAAASITPTPASAPVATDNGQVITQKQAAAPIKHAQAATKSIATSKAAEKSTSAVTQSAPTYEVARPTAQVAKPLCVNCGTVESITPIQRDGVGGGGGALAGGVLGALLGNQIGGGDGKAIATVLGAVGGGMAGNAVEKKMKKETVYQVQVRMEDGSLRTLEQATPASVGAHVIVDGNTLQPFSR